MSQPVYKINHLTKIYKTGYVLANDDISLEVKQGEIFGIFGPNDAGKTTLVRQMAGTWVLDHLTCDDHLDFLVSFSSVATFLMNPGRADTEYHRPL